MILIAASISLLVIIGGMMLLAKTQKENLSTFFKYVSYFIIIAGFLNFIGAGAFGMMKMCYKQGMHHNKMKEMYKGNHAWMYGNKPGEETGMHMQHREGYSPMGEEMPCCGIMKNSCKDKMGANRMKGMNEEDCEMKKMQCLKKIEKDSVIIKKK